MRSPRKAAARGVLLILGLLPVLVAGEASGQLPGRESQPMATIELTGADDGRTVDLQTGDVVVVRLDENPTTGYRWVLEPDGEPVMALQSSDYVQPDGAGVGGGGRRLLTLKAVKPGTETVRLKLSRKWEAGGPIPKMFAVTFRVQG